MELNDDSQTRVLKTECFKFTALFHERKKITTNSNNHPKNYDPSTLRNLLSICTVEQNLF